MATLFARIVARLVVERQRSSMTATSHWSARLVSWGNSSLHPTIPSGHCAVGAGLDSRRCWDGGDKASGKSEVFGDVTKPGY
ncbi:hypothetical protein D3C87_1550880 [compost metagenome]